MGRTEAVAPEQMVLDGMPEPEFDTHGFTDMQIARAAANVAECKELLVRIPELIEVAYGMVLERVAQAGHAGTRWLGEQVRAWLADTHDGIGFTNGIVAVLMRFIISEHPWVAGFVTIRPCAIDVVMAQDG